RTENVGDVRDITRGRALLVTDRVAACQSAQSDGIELRLLREVGLAGDTLVQNVPCLRPALIDGDRLGRRCRRGGRVDMNSAYRESRIRRLGSQRQQHSEG